MNRSARPDPPRILVLHAAGQLPGGVLREVCAGMEEEGVPFEVRPGEPDDGPQTALDLAFRAARRSTLEVGIGIDAAGGIVVHQAKLPRTQPVSQTARPTTRSARAAGHDAARVVVGAPLTSARPTATQLDEETR